MLDRIEEQLSAPVPGALENGGYMQSLLQQSYDRLRPRLKPPGERKQSRSIWPRIAAAACFLIGISIGGYFFLHKAPNQQTAQVVKNDIAPGHNQATLTL